MRIGVDLGTYNSSAAVVLGNQRVEMIQSRHGKTKYGKGFPSFVLFDLAGNKQAVGEPAKRESVINPGLVVWGAKRLVGLSFEEARKNQELARFAYPIERDEAGGIVIRMGSRVYTPQDVLQLILEEIKRDAEDEQINPLIGGETIDAAVVTVPADFKAWRINPIIQAAERAGFGEVMTIAEPTAAAIRYGLTIEDETTILAFDMGAGTLDVTLLDVVRVNDQLIPGEICTSGHEAFGGIDIDSTLMGYLSDRHGVAVDLESMARFREDVEKAKMRLSNPNTKKVQVELPDYREVELKLDEMESVLRGSLNSKCRDPLRLALELAGRSAHDIDHVIFIGGPTHMRCVKDVVHDELKKLGARKHVLKEVEKLLTTDRPVDPMTCVAEGASLKAGGSVSPAVQALAEGYGTLLAGNQYLGVIEPGSKYPIDNGVGIVCGDPSARVVPVTLVAKTPVSVDQKKKRVQFEYTNLGAFRLAIIPTGEPPQVSLRLDVDENRRAHAVLQHVQTGTVVRYSGLDLFEGAVIHPQEYDAENVETPSSSPSQPDSLPSWGSQELEQLIHIAGRVLDEVVGQQSEVPRTVSETSNHLRSTVTSAGRHMDPQLCPEILNRTQSLLAELAAAGLVSREAYRKLKGFLDQIV